MIQVMFIPLPNISTGLTVQLFFLDLHFQDSRVCDICIKI